MARNENIDVEEYIRKIIRSERKPSFIGIETASRTRSLKNPMIDFEVADPPALIVGGPNGNGAGE